MNPYKKAFGITAFFTLAISCSSIRTPPMSPSLDAASNKGCLSAAGTASFNKSALESIRPWADTKEQADMIDRFVRVEILWALKKFEVNPSVAYFDDGNSPNAFASSISTHNATDGSIRLGGNLVHSEFRRWRTNLYEDARRRGKDPLILLQQGKAGAAYAVSAIIAHEAAHILQVKMGVATPSRNTELQADFLAGWYFANKKAIMKEEFTEFKIKEDGLYAFWSRGDYFFNSPSHHGTPDQRVEAFTAGFKLGDVSLQKAWNASMEYRRRIGG